MLLILPNTAWEYYVFHIFSLLIWQCTVSSSKGYEREKKKEGKRRKEKEEKGKEKKREKKRERERARERKRDSQKVKRFLV